MTLQRQLQGKTILVDIPRPAECDQAAYVQWTEGLGCIICSFVISIISCVMAYDREFNAPHTDTRFITLCTMVCAFVIGNWGVWKLGFRETEDRHHFYVLRIAVGFHTLLPVLIGIGTSWFPWNLQFLCIPLAVLSIPGGAVAVILYNVRIVRFCKMLGWTGFAWAQSLTVPVVPLVACFAPRFWFAKNGDASCIWDLIESPSPVYESGRVCAVA